MLTYLSVCSGIEAASVAWEPLGWEAAAFSEIEAFPRAVLQHRFPHVPVHGDFTTIGGDEYGTVDLLVGGTPCQSFSVAGLRGGMADERGNLALEFLRLAERTRARWVVWENVPGVLSSNGGRDFGSFIGGLVQLGYGFAYRVLDAQYFGVPQRRRRVFVVGYLGDWRPAAAVLLKPHCLSGDPAPLRAPGQEVAACLGASPASGGSPNVGNGQGNIVGTLTTRLANNAMGAPEVDGGMYLPWPAEVAPTLNAAFGDKQGLEDQHALGGAGLFVPGGVMYATDGQANAAFSEDVALALTAHNEQPYIAAPDPVAFTVSEQANGFVWERPVYQTLNAQRPSDTSNIQQGVRIGSAVRRLTPRECERLQGFPDDWTLIPYRGKGPDRCPDGPRYKALGNSMAVPVMRWIGEQIACADRLALAGSAA